MEVAILPAARRVGRAEATDTGPASRPVSKRISPATRTDGRWRKTDGMVGLLSPGRAGAPHPGR